MTPRDEYVDKLKKQLDRWNADMAAWEAKAKAAQAGVRAGYEKQLAALRLQRDHALEKLHEVQSASSSAWREVARGADQAWKQLRDAFDRAGEHFRK